MISPPAFERALEIMEELFLRFMFEAGEGFVPLLLAFIDACGAPSDGWLEVALDSGRVCCMDASEDARTLVSFFAVTVGDMVGDMVVIKVANL